MKSDVSTQVAKDIVNEIIDKVCTANDQINVSKHIVSDLGDVSQQVASGLLDELIAKVCANRDKNEN